MRISDWSSDVCSSDLILVDAGLGPAERAVRVVALCRDRLETPLAVAAFQADTVAELIVVATFVIHVMNGELHRNDVVLRVWISQHRRLEFLHIGIGENFVVDLIADTQADRKSTPLNSSH